MPRAQQKPATCSKLRRADCEAMEGCQWQVGKGCKALPAKIPDKSPAKSPKKSQDKIPIDQDTNRPEINTINQGATSFTPEECAKWRGNPSVNPRTGRKLSKTAKNGIYHKLVKDCTDITSPKENKPNETKANMTKNKEAKKDKNKETKANNINANAGRRQLIRAMKKTVNPLLDKSNFTKSRIQLKSVVSRYLKDIKPCIVTHEKDTHSYLVGIDNRPLVYLSNRIGTDSKVGVAYLNKGAGFARLLKFACKVMQTTNSNLNEVRVLKELSASVEAGETPNMPMTYMDSRCTNGVFSKYKDYLVTFSELADSDLETLYTKDMPTEVHESLVMQMILAINFFHGKGYLHNDLHLGNFLVHRIQPGGYWRYKVGTSTVYVPNTGYLLVMWDFGTATKYSEKKQIADYIRPVDIIIRMREMFARNKKKKMKLPPAAFIESTLRPLLQQLFMNNATPESTAMESLLTMIANGQISMRDVHVNPQVPPGYLLNVKAYTL